MIELGCCTDIPVSEAARKKICKIKEAGFDYVELNFQAAAALTPGERREAARFLEESGLPCRAMNCLLPGSLPVVGPEADLGKVREYLETAFPAAKELGAKTVVFGSGAARRIPVGFSREIAWVQLVGFLRLADSYCAPHGLEIAIEPLCWAECNALNTLMEGYRLVTDANRPRIGLLADFYHLQRNREDPLDILSASPMLRHIHTANLMDRGFPREGTFKEHSLLFSMLRQAGYRGGVSVEGRTENFDRDVLEAGRVLRQIRDEYRI